MEERLQDGERSGGDVDDDVARSRSVGIPPDAAATVAEDMAHGGWRKPSSDDVERERTERARKKEPCDDSHDSR